MPRFLALLTLLFAGPAAAADRPNVVVVLTDDQGYGDFSRHGNPVLKTPHLDRLAAQSVRLTDFHVSPMCTPTRGQLMTGMDALRNGASAVCAGRAFVRPGIPFLPEVFKAGGYKTGIFGKWHLGDSYPNRPTDRGFGEAVYHNGWGITSVADRWNNDYFDPTLLHNGAPKKYAGYCTDVFFREALGWMADRAAKQEPFFCYLPTNAPHGPLWCPAESRKPYLGKVPPAPASFFGMVSNIDDNVGRLLAFLDEKKLAENTIVIFFHDNGGTAGVNVFNAGMRGRKATYYEGGHRAACFVRWPNGDLGPPRDVDALTLVQDLFPTLVAWCRLPAPAGWKPDGRWLFPRPIDAPFAPERTAVVQFGESPAGSKLEKFNCCVLRDAADGRKWRLVHGTELYDVKADPGQKADVADKHPDVVKQLRDHYEKWWAGVGPTVNDYVPVVLGADAEYPVTLTSADWAGAYADNATRDVRGGLNKNGPWHVKVERDGEYEIRLRRWPAEADAAMSAGVPAFKGVDGELPPGKALPVAAARLKVGDFDRAKPVAARDKEAVFTVPLKATAKTQLQTWLRDAAGNDLCGAFYVYVKRK